MEWKKSVKKDVERQREEKDESTKERERETGDIKPDIKTPNPFIQN